ncbi:MAG: TonB-dependent receptor, partial [Pseudomonadales bacterium]|nr:TonB-dependent receptor [Pseudomonadales bacterium]
GWSETVVRPDLREITDASYIDPITDDLVDGNPGVIPADVSNYDIRTELFFNNGDNLTLSAFHKDIVNPIEFFESAASDTTVAREIVNATSAKVSGVEIEALKTLNFLSGIAGDWINRFFVQANLTLQDSELVAGEKADAPTNDVRPLRQRHARLRQRRRPAHGDNGLQRLRRTSLCCRSARRARRLRAALPLPGLHLFVVPHRVHRGEGKAQEHPRRHRGNRAGGHRRVQRAAGQQCVGQLQVGVLTQSTSGKFAIVTITGSAAWGNVS